MSIYKQNRQTGQSYMTPAQQAQFAAFQRKGVEARVKKSKQGNQFMTGMYTGGVASAVAYTGYKIAKRIPGKIGNRTQRLGQGLKQTLKNTFPFFKKQVKQRKSDFVNEPVKTGLIQDLSDSKKALRSVVNQYPSQITSLKPDVNIEMDALRRANRSLVSQYPTTVSKVPKAAIETAGRKKPRTMDVGPLGDESFARTSIKIKRRTIKKKKK